MPEEQTILVGENMIHEIKVRHIRELSKEDRKRVLKDVKTRPESFQKNFKGYVKITTEIIEEDESYEIKGDKYGNNSKGI